MGNRSMLFSGALALMFFGLLGVSGEAHADVTIVNSGTTVDSQVSASASSGGNNSGDTSVKTGNASASVRTMVEVDEEGGTATTETTVVEQGVEEKTTDTRTYAPGENVVIKKTATAGSSSEHSASVEIEAGLTGTTSIGEETQEEERHESIPAFLSWFTTTIISPVFAFFGWS